MRIIAALTDPASIRSYLDGVGLPAAATDRAGMTFSAARALVSPAAIVSLITSTRGEAGLRVRSEIDQRHYPAGVSVSDEQMATIALRSHRFDGDLTVGIPAPPSADRGARSHPRPR